MKIRDMFDDMVDVVAQMVVKWERYASFPLTYVHYLTTHADLDLASGSILPWTLRP